jgi:SAM-dependent methyltransferase
MSKNVSSTRKAKYGVRVSEGDTLALPADGYHLIDETTALRRGNNMHFGPVLDLLDNLSCRLDSPPLVLDCGCGSGQLGAMLRARKFSGRYLGMDICLEHLCEGKKFYGHDAYLTGNVEALPFSDGTIDAVVSLGVLFTIPEAWKAVRELHRVASKLVILNLNVAPLGATAMRLHYGGKDDSFMWMPNMQYCHERFADMGLHEPVASILWETPEDVGHDRKVYRGLTHRFNAIFVWEPACQEPEKC